MSLKTVHRIIDPASETFYIAKRLFKYLVTSKEIDRKNVNVLNITFDTILDKKQNITILDIISNHNDLYCAVFRAAQVALEYIGIIIVDLSYEDKLNIQKYSTSNNNYKRGMFGLNDPFLLTKEQRQLANEDCACLLFALCKPKYKDYNVIKWLYDIINYFRQYLRDEDKDLDFKFYKSFIYLENIGWMPDDDSVSHLLPDNRICQSFWFTH